MRSKKLVNFALALTASTVGIQPAFAIEKQVKCSSGTVIVDTGTSSARFVDPNTGNVTDVYGGNQKIIDAAPCKGGIITAFSGKGIYYSPSCLAIGRADSQGTEEIYGGSQKVVSMRAIGEEVEILFEQRGNYITRNCKEAGVHITD
ncbi:hypothetical protein [Denitromonas sp.]|uniref:hypothetical protein n=1 Tax=Denitromonas sp. TaxID=2734609 RepID=UPI003A89005E